MLNAVELLKHQGDPIEQFIVAKYDETSLNKVIYPYSDVWYNFIYPKRLPSQPNRVQTEWMRFAGDHYTALIRICNAERQLSNLHQTWDDVGKVEMGELLLRVHEASASFWWNLGSMVENLGNALIEFPYTKLRDKGKEYLENKFPQLGYAYDRRTQLIHNRVFPVKVKGSDLVFAFCHLGYQNENPEIVAKYTDWDQPHEPNEMLNEFYDKAWKQFLIEACNAWYHVHSLFCDWTKGSGELIPSDCIMTPPVRTGISIPSYSNVPSNTPMLESEEVLVHTVNPFPTTSISPSG